MDLIIVTINQRSYVFKLTEEEAKVFDADDLNEVLVDSEFISPSPKFFDFLQDKFEEDVMDGLYTWDDIRYANIQIMNTDTLETISLNNMLNK